jgi:hypothetical protein
VQEKQRKKAAATSGLVQGREGADAIRWIGFFVCIFLVQDVQS